MLLPLAKIHQTALFFLLSTFNFQLTANLVQNSLKGINIDRTCCNIRSIEIKWKCIMYNCIWLVRCMKSNQFCQYFLPYSSFSFLFFSFYPFYFGSEYWSISPLLRKTYNIDKKIIVVICIIKYIDIANILV